MHTPTGKREMRGPGFTQADAYRWLMGARALQHRVRRALLPAGLSMEAWLILEVLAMRAQSASDLTMALAMEKGSLSRWLSRLSDDDLIRYEQPSADHRRKPARLTEKGEATLRAARGNVSDSLTRASIPMTSTERSTVDELSNLLRAAWRRPKHERHR